MLKYINWLLIHCLIIIHYSFNMQLRIRISDNYITYDDLEGHCRVQNPLLFSLKQLTDAIWLLFCFLFCCHFVSDEKLYNVFFSVEQEPIWWTQTKEYTYLHTVVFTLLKNFIWIVCVLILWYQETIWFNFDFNILYSEIFNTMIWIISKIITQINTSTITSG